MAPSEVKGRCRINRYIMECKFKYSSNNFKSLSELIDTLWNVNIIPLQHIDYIYCELIDTLWNVN